VLGTLPPIFNGLGSGQSTLNARIRQLAAEEGIECADVSAAFNYNRNLIMDDGLHPTSQGQQLIATTFRNAIWASPVPVAFQLTPSSVQAPDTGVSGGQFTVSSASAWVAGTTDSWITVVSGAGTGAGTVTYDVDPNTGWARAGTIQVISEGVTRSFTVNQAEATLTVTPDVSCIPSAGAIGTSLAVTAHLPWTATAGEAWITFPAGSSGTGSGSLAITVAANAGTVRTGSVVVTVGEKSVTAKINQWPEPDVPGVSAESDFDGDGTADYATFEPANGEWTIRFANGVTWQVPWGWNAVKPVPADYDGDGILDIAVYYPTGGNWYVLQSSDGQTRAEAFGWNATIPLPGDYDGDGLADLAVFHQPSAMWYFRYSGGGPDYGLAYGWSSVIPVPADYDGDGVMDIAVYHPASGNWFCFESGTGDVNVVPWGWSSAIPVPTDYDGDGAADIAVFYRRTATWYIRYSGGGDWVQAFGWSSVVPVPADYDRDGAADVSVYHAAGGNGYTLQSTTGTTTVDPMGGAGCESVLLSPLIHQWYHLP